jgi:SAM-dependent methyltransferase
LADQETIAAYDAQVDAYVGMTKPASPDSLLVAFIGLVRPGGYVLDLGCGPANAAAAMRQGGLTVDAVDASAEMVRIANETHDIGARRATFEDIDTNDTYDGIWANFSLLHAPAEDFPHHLNALHRALRRGGRFHIGMKIGIGAARDRLGRQYTYYSPAELSEHLVAACFVIDHTATGEDLGLAGDVEPWIALTAHK